MPRFPALRPESDKMLHMDVLRFIAASGIVLLHTAEMVGWDRPGLKFFVDLFFALSGYVLADVYGGRMKTIADYGEFLWKRGARLLPLHWLTLALWVAFALVAAKIGMKATHAQEFDFRCLAPNALLLHATGLCDHLSFNGPSWSISAEAFMYLAFPVIAFLGWRAAFITAVAIPLLSLVPGAPWYEWMSHFGVVRALPSFCFGVALFSLRLAAEKVPPIIGTIAFAAFILTALAGLYGVWQLGLIYVGVIGAASADGRRSVGKATKILAPLAQLTYSSYMIHTLILMAFLSLGADRVLHLHGAARVVMAALAYVVVWPVSYLSLVLFEHPARRRLTRLLPFGKSPIAAPAAEAAR